MILNISYHTLELKEEIETTIGKPFSWWERLKMKGIGSQRFQVLQASTDFQKLFDRDGAMNVCNIELRQGGIMLHFRTRQETYGWVMPYHALTVFKTDNTLSLFGGADQVKLMPAHNASLDQGFIRKLIQVKANQALVTGLPGRE